VAGAGGLVAGPARFRAAAGDSQAIRGRVDLCLDRFHDKTRDIICDKQIDKFVISVSL
jgi:hypothetical protein